MRHRLRSLLALAAAVQVWIGSPVRADPIDDVMTRHLAAAEAPGAAVVVVRHGAIEVERTYGLANVEWEQPVTNRTRFQLASVTKLFTAVALMRLQERGVLDLDDPVGRHLDGVPESWSGVTLRRLAGHASGVSEAIGPNDGSVDGIVRAALATPLAYVPGAEARYGFVDYVILHRAMERASGLGFTEILDREVLRPLDLDDTAYDHAVTAGDIRSARPLERRADVYTVADDGLRRHEYHYPANGYAAGGLYSSPRDVARLLQALQTGFLPREALEDMLRPARLASGAPSSFGVGWNSRSTRGRPIAAHSGGPALADVQYAWDDGLAVIVLTNQHRLLPLVAENILDLHLTPDFGPTVALDAPRERAVRLALASAAAGDLDESVFTEAGLQAAGPFLREWGLQLGRAVGALNDVRLSTVGDDRDVLIIRFQHQPMRWRVAFSEDHRIMHLAPTG